MVVAKSTLVIVESPTKAKTIRKFLPKNYIVEASMGHVRDLPESAADIPAKFKKEEWSKLGVNVDENFEPLYVVNKRKTKIIQELKKKLEKVDEVLLATDEDREGESIAWHLMQTLKPKVPVKRMVFHEITKAAIQKSLEQTRKIDDKLVSAQETRRILDRLYGYTLSPLIWKKIAFGLSAGRVQSVALKVIVERERSRFRFKKSTYWDLLAELLAGPKKDDAFTTKLTTIKGVRIATGKDFDETTGEIVAGKKLGHDIVLLDEKKAEEWRKKLKHETYKVASVTEKPLTNRPSPPFITSTLQQEANRKLGLSAKEAMRTAQTLYEEGLITYMRTDSPNLSQEAIRAARAMVEELYGKEYLSPEPRQYTSKSKGAQEAHEAIRPAGSEFVHPKASGLSGKELALYELIWKRTMATQMSEAQKISMTVQIQAGEAGFSASGTRITFPGFLRAYVEGSDDPEAALEDKEVLLPKVKVGDELMLKDLTSASHETKPPARFTEASLVQMLEKEGIGRPSTYATIIGTIIDRGYVRKVGPALIPSFTGFAVTQLLEKNFKELVDPGFTSKMEESLDEIAEGTLESLPYLKKFYLGKAGLQNQVKSQEKSIDPDQSRTIDLDHLGDVQVKVGRYGPYIVKEAPVVDETSKKGKKKTEEVHASIPEDIAPADLKIEDIANIIEMSQKGPQPIGQHSKTGENIFCLLGRFGPYVQLGEATEEQPKPKRASIPKGVEPKTVTTEMAETWLELPRELGVHPDSGKAIITNNGRFGPYVMCDGDFRSLKKEDNVYTIDLKRALELLSAPKGVRGGSTLVKEVGKHPDSGKPIQILDGKFGMYVKHGTLNVTLPKDTNPENIGIQEAVALLASKAKVTAKSSGKGAKAKRKSA